jgi:hypothetical protein
VLDTIAGMSREDWPALAEVTQADVDDIDFAENARRPTEVLWQPTS